MTGGHGQHPLANPPACPDKPPVRLFHRPLPAALGLGLIAQLLFSWRLTTPHTLVFDEVHYVPAARMLRDLGGPVNIEHPLLGKTLIAAGMALFGDDPLGWRIGSTLAATAVVIGVFAILYLLFGRVRTAGIGATLAILNFTVFVQARTAMLDGYMAAFVVTGVATLLWAMQAQTRGQAWRRWIAGAVLLEHEPVTAVASGVVHLATREIRASYVLVTVDGHLEQLLPGLPVDSWRLQMAYYPVSSGARLSVPTYMRWGFDYGIDLDPLVHGAGFALGGFRDRDLPGERATAWPGPAVPSSRVQSGIDELAAQIAGAPVAPSCRWAATVSYTADLWPLVAEAAPGVWVVGGLSGHGNLIGPLAARAIAGHLTGVAEGSETLSWLAR